MNNIDKQYTKLLQDIIHNGVEKKDRTGTGTISVFGRQIRHKMSEGFPLLTTKKMAFKTMVTELLWFLRGDTNIKYLVDNGCHIWDGDAYKRYYNSFPDAEKSFQYEGSTIETRRMTKEEFIEQIKTDDEFAKKWGELGPIYGKQWRNWRGIDRSEMRMSTYRIDQIANLISELKTNPDSRRLIVNAWNVGELDQMVLPPCHYGFQVYTRELSLDERLQVWDSKFGFANDEQKNQFNPDVHLDTHGIPKRAISLMWNQRSVDTFLGLPFNIASYALLLEIIAKEVNMVPDELIGNLGDVHLYSNHKEQAVEQIGRELTHRERIEKLFETNKDAKSLLSQEEPEVISSLLLDELKIPKRTREPYELPILAMITNPELKFDEYVYENFRLINYQSHPSIKAPLSN